ncbi:glycosyltransferase family 2 protein [Ketogulonicigenium vulgare]|uniref:glycosyltransferase family 2 protein n=1 Tax=Ketogulonicigenium vulgare TaxID=92945 RepID=UPI00235A1AA7|nr:glycosyltransferase family 2 protein [Ketogulonicigenium vulgare]
MEDSTLTRIKFLLSRGELKNAVILLSTAELTSPDLEDAYVMLGDFSNKSKDFEGAEKYYSLAIESSKTIHRISALKELVRMRLRQGRLADAAKALSTHHDDVATDPLLMLFAARAFAELSDFPSAIRHVENAVESGGLKYKEELIQALRSIAKPIRPENADASEELATILKIHSAEPGSADLNRILGEVMAKILRFEEALKFLEIAYHSFPKGAKKIAVFDRMTAVTEASGLDLPQSISENLVQSPAIHKQFNVAAITNVFNETYNMGTWLDHYGRQVGIEKCIVLDHGSNDGSTDDLKGAGVVRLARGLEFNERHRMKLINDLANSLLGYYDAVIYSDCDEMIVADPDKYENLVDYAKQTKRPVSFALGLNVRHDPSKEADLTEELPILAQRTLVQFVSPMCKPLLIKDQVSWGGGFHCCQHPPDFDDLYLFHLRHADMARALSRLETTKQIKFAREGGGKHHRRDANELVERVYVRAKNFPVHEDFNFEEVSRQHALNCALTFSGRYAVQKTVNVPYFNRIPERFRAIF